MTRCSSAQEFIERFARFTTETEVVVPALPNVQLGATGQFVITLKDQSVMMQGRCEVTEVRPVAPAPDHGPAASARALMRLHLLEMDAHSCGIHLRLMERRASLPKQPPAFRPAPARRVSGPALSLVPPLRLVPPANVAPAVEAAPVGAATMEAQGSAGALAVAAPLPLETEQTEASPLPQVETRVPGADFTLPANPLSDLEAADLASVVELTLLEHSGVVVSGAPPAAAPSDARRDSVRRIARRVAPTMGGLLVGLLVGIALKSGSKPAPVVPAPDVVASPAAEPPARELAAPAPPPPAPADEVPAPSPRECIARVTTTPPGATVSWGELALGSSPIEHGRVPCGAAIVRFRRERYADATVTIAAEPGRDAVVVERLHRPPAKLVVTSSPPNAVIKLNQRRFGPTPRKISTLRFEHVRVEASLPGYRPWKKTVYLREAESKLDVTLVRAPRSTAGSGPRPASR